MLGVVYRKYTALTLPYLEKTSSTFSAVGSWVFTENATNKVEQFWYVRS